MTMNGGEILILTGAPGSGKTTVARMLTEMRGAPKVHLHADDFWHAIRHGAIAPYRPEAHAQNAVVIDVLANAAARYAAGGFFVIVDGIVGPWFLAPFRALTPILHYVVLRPSLDTAVARCRARGGDTLTNADTIAYLHRQFAALGELEHHGLPIGQMDMTQTADAVVAAVRSHRFRLYG